MVMFSFPQRENHALLLSINFQDMLKSILAGGRQIEIERFMAKVHNILKNFPNVSIVPIAIYDGIVSKKQ